MSLGNLRNLRISFSSSPKRLRRFQNLFRPRPHQVVLREVYPTNGAAGIQQKLRGPGDVLTIDSRSRMEQVIAANRLRLRIRKKREGVSGSLTQVERDFGTVYADSNRANSRDSKLRKRPRRCTGSSRKHSLPFMAWIDCLFSFGSLALSHLRTCDEKGLRILTSE